jgi:hypothetical protein
MNIGRGMAMTGAIIEPIEIRTIVKIFVAFEMAILQW